MSISKNISKTMASLLKLAYKWEDAKHPVPELGTRFYFDEIMFEITRKCNLKCAHCLRGEMQPVSMPTEVIDKMLEVSSGIEGIFLTGGEPFLEPSIIEYLVDKIIELDFDTKHLSVITNGTILNDNGIRCAKAFDKFAKWRISKGEEQDWYALIAVSNDDFHGADVDKAVEFYKKHTENVWVVDKGYDEDVSPYGRAVENNLSDSPCINYTEYAHRLRIDEGNIVRCLLTLTYKGNLTYPELKEWEMVDTVSIGNIMEESLESMLECNQWEELRCWESKILDGSDYGRGQIDPKITETYTYMFKHIKDGRKLLHEELPYIDYATICSLVDLSAYDSMGDTWLRLVGYSEEEIKKANEELSEEFTDHFFKICQENNYYLCMSGAPKSRQVPYDKEQKHVSNCEL